MRTFLVTGGAGFIGSHIAEALGRARRPRARARQSFDRPRREPRSTYPTRSSSSKAASPTEAPWPLRSAASTASFTRRPWQRAAQRRAPAGHQRGLRHRHADHAGRSPPSRRAAAGLCRFEQRLRRSAHVAQARDRSARSDFALWRRQTGGRVVLPRVLGNLRFRDGLHSLFQRLRPAAGSQQPVFGRDSAVHHGHAGRPPAHDLWRRLPVARFHVRGQRRSRKLVGGRRRGLASCRAARSTSPTAATPTCSS